MRNYELVCVLEAAPAEELKTIEQSVMAILEKREATVGKTESWGQRPLYHEAKAERGCFSVLRDPGQSRKD